MNTQTKPSSRLRLIALIAVLLAAGFLLFEDRIGRSARVQQKLDLIDLLKDTEEANVQGVKAASIHAIMGDKFEVFEDEKHEYTVETYTIGNRLPLGKGEDTVNVVYHNGSFLMYQLNKDYDPTDVKRYNDLKIPPVEERLVVGPGGN